MKFCLRERLYCSKITLFIKLESLLYFMEYSAHFFYIENDAEIFPAHYSWKVAEKGFKIAFMISFAIILEK
jgi:hypothetical protein